MEQDFYIDERWLSSYFEKDWFDQVLLQSPKVEFHFPQFELSNLYSPYHEQFVEFISNILETESIRPKSLLEVGSALGRTYFECSQRITSLENATLVEPSQNLARTFLKIFKEGHSFSILKKFKDTQEVYFDPSEIRTRIDLPFELVNKPYEDLGEKMPMHDLVICSNVIDQCKEPEKLVDFLKECVIPNGVLALSCTYQWNDKYVSDEFQLDDIKKFFLDWKCLGETNVEFKCRRNERYWLTFLSHVVLLQKK
jgi:SAM-dependent methyltransferase